MDTSVHEAHRLSLSFRVRVSGREISHMPSYYVYILASAANTLYVGVTNNLSRRLYQHRHKLIPGFSSRYNVDRLVHYEETPDVRAAIAREKQIKACGRSKKTALIEASNSAWNDLSAAWPSAE